MRLLIVAAFILCQINSKAQTSRVGFKVLPGLTYQTSLTNRPNQESEFKKRFTIELGITWIYQLKPNFSVELGLCYVDRGILEENVEAGSFIGGINSSEISDIYYHNYYLSLPVLARFQLAEYYISFGPSLEYYLKSKYNWKPEDLTAELDLTEQSYSRFQLGLNFLFGRDIYINDKLHSLIEAKFNTSKLDKSKGTMNNFVNFEFGVGLIYRI